MPQTTTQESRTPGLADVLTLLRDYRHDHVRMAGIAPGLEDRIWHVHAAEASGDLAAMVERLLQQAPAEPPARPAAS